MTIINNDDFTIKEKNMTTEEIEKKAPAKKAPAMKTPVNDDYSKQLRAEEDKASERACADEREREAEARLDVEGKKLYSKSYVKYLEALAKDRDLHIEEKKELSEAITVLQRNADAQKQLINSVNEKNDKLQEKLEILDVDSVKVVIPNHTLKAVVTRQIMRVNEKLSNSVDEVNEVIEKLYADDIQEALKQVSRINDLKNRVCELEDVDTSRLDDLDYEIECAVQNELSNYDYIEDGDVNNIIEDRLDEFVTREDIDNDLKIYGREINELKARLNNTIYNKICRLFKSMFSYNLSNKVRSIFKRNKNKKIDLNEINDRIKASKK